MAAHVFSLGFFFKHLIYKKRKFNCISIFFTMMPKEITPAQHEINASKLQPNYPLRWLFPRLIDYSFSAENVIECKQKFPSELHQVKSGPHPLFNLHWSGFSSQLFQLLLGGGDTGHPQTRSDKWSLLWGLGLPVHVRLRPLITPEQDPEILLHRGQRLPNQPVWTENRTRSYQTRADAEGHLKRSLQIKVHWLIWFPAWTVSWPQLGPETQRQRHFHCQQKQLPSFSINLSINYDETPQ